MKRAHQLTSTVSKAVKRVNADMHIDAEARGILVNLVLDTLRRIALAASDACDDNGRVILQVSHVLDAIPVVFPEKLAAMTTAIVEKTMVKYEQAEGAAMVLAKDPVIIARRAALYAKRKETAEAYKANPELRAQHAKEKAEAAAAHKKEMAKKKEAQAALRLIRNKEKKKKVLAERAEKLQQKVDGIKEELFA